jgi:NAD(P)-dependent dehydrogenase (short-subunit alcohol dehydrogenase family)
MAVLVTGGSSGIGRAVAEHWARRGHDVVINYHANDEAAEEAVAGVRAAGGRAHLVKADVASQAGVDAVVSKVREVTSALDLYVHCAALARCPAVRWTWIPSGSQPPSPSTALRWSR